MVIFNRRTLGNGITLVILATSGITQENGGDANTDEKEGHDSSAEINQHQDVGAGAKHGIHAASVALRHADIAVTSQFYADSQARVRLDFGHLLSGPDEKIVNIQAPTPPKKAAKARPDLLGEA
jgi:hypothetical protein